MAPLDRWGPCPNVADMTTSPSITLTRWTARLVKLYRMDLIIQSRMVQLTATLLFTSADLPHIRAELVSLRIYDAKLRAVIQRVDWEIHVKRQIADLLTNA
jgi:hypothetical protein